MTDPQNSAAFERIVRPHLDRLYRFAWRLTAARSEAEDLFQETLIKVFGKQEDLLRVEQPGPWLARVMYNLFVDNRRRFSRRRLVIVEEGQLPGEGLAEFAGGDDPEATGMRDDRIQQLERALDTLSEEHRLVVLMHDTEGYKLEEIQEITGVPLGTVKSRLHRARARLRQVLENDGTYSAE